MNDTKRHPSLAARLTVYTPDDRQAVGFFKSLWFMLKNIVDSRDLIFRLFIRDFFSGYKKSFLGVAWVLIAPLLGAVTWVFMNATGVLQPGNTGIPYPAYLLLGTSFWGLFLGLYQSTSGTLSAGQGFILQVHYPHEALLMKQTLEQFATFACGFVVNLVILMIFGVIPSWKIIFLPVFILPLFFVGAALGLIASVVNVVGQEGKKLLDYGLALAFYVTPVIYSRQITNPILSKVIRYNPLTYLVSAPRDIIAYGHLQSNELFLLNSAGSFIFFLLSLRFFYLSERYVIEKLL